MRGSDDKVRPGRIAAFLAIGLVLYAGLFIGSDRNLSRHAGGNPFYRIATAPEHSDWIILGASHALPLGFADVPDAITDRTGKSTFTLAMTGGGPFTWHMIARRYFADHSTRGVLIVLDDFGFADARWNGARLGDTDVLPKIPADARTMAVLANATGDQISFGTFAAYATGFARINDQTRFDTDRWSGEERFDTAPRPSDAADASRIAFLYPSPPDQHAISQGLADLEAVIRLAQTEDADVIVLRPPVPDRFRTRLPALPGFEIRLRSLLEAYGVELHDYSELIPEPRYYFDTDHLNRIGVERFLDEALTDLLRGDNDRGQ